MPPGDVCNQLTEVILQLSRKYSTPNFEPHVTLLGGLTGTEEEILSKTSKLANLIQPYAINLTKMDYLDECFKCLFIKVEETESVLKANVKAREIFNQQQDPKYMPHLSLIYGSLSPDTKERIIKEIVGKFDFKFEARSIHVFLTDSKPENWSRVKEFPLSSY